MQIRKFRAVNMHEALGRVRAELGPEASVLQTREVRVGGVLGFGCRQEIEVTASRDANVPSRLPQIVRASARAPIFESEVARPDDEGIDLGRLKPVQSYSTTADKLPNRAVVRPSLSLQGIRASATGTAICELHADLLEAGLTEEYARQLVERVQGRVPAEQQTDGHILKSTAEKIVQGMIRVTGPIEMQDGRPRLVALVGPTGVGKTTTIAKLAANFRLKEKARVGLITVDTYRIAAVEQLRTYADIIDLPMEVVSSPRDMRGAVERLGDLDLILMDTAGRSPRDEVKIRELKLILAEAEADETHLVLSSVSSADNLIRAVRKFQPVGLSTLLFTKLDESATAGHLLPVIDDCRLPLSYLTHGQNVPEDIEPAEAEKMARRLLALEDKR